MMLFITACAEDLTWQGIPWGCTPEEAAQILTEKGIIAEGALERARDNHSTYYLGKGSTSYKELYHNVWSDACWAYQISSGDILAQIAGYDVLELSLHYVLDSTENKKLVMISIEPLSNGMSSDEIYTDLKAKLDKVYGVTPETDFLIKSSAWEKGNGFVFINSMTPVRIIYSDANVEDIIAANSQPAFTPSNSTNGL